LLTIAQRHTVEVMRRYAGSARDSHLTKGARRNLSGGSQLMGPAASELPMTGKKRHLPIGPALPGPDEGASHAQGNVVAVRVIGDGITGAGTVGASIDTADT
jgi:hypothetical protein